MSSQPAFLLRAHAADANFKIMHTLVSSYAPAQPLARAPYVVLFDLKPLNKDGNVQVGMYCMHAQKGT